MPRTWAIGLLLGALDGFLALEVPFLGALLTLAAALLLSRVERRVAGLGGLLLGGGGVWTGFLVRAAATCAAANATPDQGCSMPDISGFVVAGMIVTIAGLALSVAAARRRR
jgi:hypothetical protein